MNGREWCDREPQRACVNKQRGGCCRARQVTSVMSNSLQPYGLQPARLLCPKFSRQEYWSGLSFLSPEAVSDPGVKPASLTSPALADGFFTTVATWEALILAEKKETYQNISICSNICWLSVICRMYCCQYSTSYVFSKPNLIWLDTLFLRMKKQTGTCFLILLNLTSIP